MVEMNREWDYNVSIRDIQVVDSEQQIVRRTKATVDDTTGEMLGLVSPRYVPIQNKTIHDVMTEIGGDLGLSLQKIDICKNKRLAIFRYTFGDNTRTVEDSTEADDKIRFGFEAINSFDGALGGGKFRAFAERLVCINGMTVPKEVGNISFRSLGDLSSERLKTVLQNRIEPLFSTVSTWNKWAQVSPNRNRVGEFISQNFGKKASEEMLTQYDSAKDQSLWGLYNLVTFHITHNLKTRDISSNRLGQINAERIASKFYTEQLT